MKFAINIGPQDNKGCKALERAAHIILKQVDPTCSVEYLPSGYTDKTYDAYFCIEGDNIAYWNSNEFKITENALKMGIPSFGLGLDISPRLGRFTNLPQQIIRTLCLFDGILLRSQGSIDIANRYGVESVKIPDLAWILNPKEIDYNVPDNTIAIAAYQNIDGIKDYIRKLVLYLKFKGYNVIQLRETNITLDIQDLETTPEEATWEQNISILKNCKALITTGFHAAIAGYKAGIPVMTLPVQEKTYWLANELKLDNPLPFSTIQLPEYIVSELQKLINNPPNPILPDHSNTPNIIRGLLNEYVTGFSIN